MAQDESLSQASDISDRCAHGLIDRRGFLDGAARHVAAGISALGLLEALSPRFAHAQKVSATDPRWVTQSVVINPARLRQVAWPFR